MTGPSIPTTGSIETLSAQQRIAWVLRTNRIYARTTPLRTARQFAKRFARAGTAQLAPSQVTRWEAGASAVGGAVVQRYEEVLDLPPGSLRFIRDALLRRIAQRPNRVDRGGEHDVHQLLDKVVRDPHLDDREWLEFCEAMQSFPDLILHPRSLWEQIADRLLGEMVVAEGRSWLVRQEALSRMLEHRDAASVTVCRCIAVAEDKAIPTYVEPISLLEATTDPAASAFLTRQIYDPLNARARYAAIQTILRKARMGHYREPDEAHRLHQAIREFLSAEDHDAATVPTVVPVMQLGHRLGLAVPQRWTRASFDDPVARSVLLENHTVPSEQTIQLCTRLALMAQSWMSADHPAEDPVFVRLLQEMLFSADDDVRLYAMFSVAATPYRQPLADALSAVLRDSRHHRPHPMLATALLAITILGGAGHRELLRDFLINPNLSLHLRQSAARAAAHCSGTQSTDDWRRIFAIQRSLWLNDRSGAETEGLDALVSALGTARNTEVLQEIATDHMLPDQIRLSAAWWRSRCCSDG